MTRPIPTVTLYDGEKEVNVNEHEVEYWLDQGLTLEPTVAESREGDEGDEGDETAGEPKKKKG